MILLPAPFTVAPLSPFPSPTGTDSSLGDLLTGNPVALVIIGCEIAFWIVLAGGLALRYFAKAKRASTAVLLLVPVVDLVLLIAVAIDLHRGTEATAVHGLAALYLGVSVAFGHRMISWADGQFAYRFAGGRKPVKPPRSGPAKAAREWKDFGLVLIAAAIAAGGILLLRYVVSTPDKTEVLVDRLGTVGIVLVIWFVAGPVWSTFNVGNRSDESTPDDRTPSRH